MAALQTAYEEKDKELSEMKESLSNMYDGESSQVSAELIEANEKLAEANKQLLAQKEEIQKLNAKQVFRHKCMYFCIIQLCNFTMLWSFILSFYAP